MNSNALLQVEDLRTYLYTDNGVVHAVDNVSLKVDGDETVGLVGESGCGKTMTALTIVRLEPATARNLSGKVIFENRDLLQMTPGELRSIRGSKIAMIYQDPMTFLNPILKIGSQVAEVVTLHQKLTQSKAWEKVLHVFDQLGIPSPNRVAASYPHQLSGGMRQRVIIAMAMICHPHLLIADEPTTALDVSVQAQIMELIKRIRTEMKNSLLIISHDLGLIAENCDRVYVMYAGQIVEHADVLTIFKNPAHPYTKGLLRSNLSPDRRVEQFDTIEGEVPNLIHPPSGCRFHPRCEFRMDRCEQEGPPLFDLFDGHRASCWLVKEGRN